MSVQIEAPIRSDELEPFPTTLIGVLKRMEKTCTVPNPLELENAYSALLDIYQDGIKTYRELAQREDIPWGEVVRGPTDFNDQDGLSWLYEEYLAMSQDSIGIHMKATTISHKRGEEKITGAVVGSLDGMILNSVYFTKFVRKEIGQELEKVEEIRVEFNQKDGITRLRIFSTPEPTNETNPTDVQTYSADITFSKPDQTS